MDMREWIIIGGGALIGLIVLHGLFNAWWRSRNPLRMKIQPALLPEDADDDAWLSAELPNGGARVVAADSPEADVSEAGLSERDATDAGDADDAIPVLLETADAHGEDGAVVASDSDLAAQAEVSSASAGSALPAGSPLPDLGPIVPERRLRSLAEEVPSPSTRVDAQPDSDHGTEPEAEPANADVADDLLVIHLLAPAGATFGGDELVCALRAQDLRFGEMDIFHRIDAATGKAVFSVARAVEPGSFDLTRIESCASPGVIAFLRLSSHDDARPALEDMISTAEAIADDLGGELFDGNRKPFTPLCAEGYRSRAMGRTDRQALREAR